MTEPKYEPYAMLRNSWSVAQILERDAQGTAIRVRVATSGVTSDRDAVQRECDRLNALRSGLYDPSWQPTD